MQSRKNGQKHIWLLTGTGEGRTLATVLVEQGWNVTVSVVSSKASWPYLEMSLTSLLVGPLKGVEGIKQVLMQANCVHERFDCVVDVTHPFAVGYLRSAHQMNRVNLELNLSSLFPLF